PFVPEGRERAARVLALGGDGLEVRRERGQPVAHLQGLLLEHLGQRSGLAGIFAHYTFSDHGLGSRSRRGAGGSKSWIGMPGGANSGGTIRSSGIWIGWPFGSSGV